MSEENVERGVRAFEAFNRRDLDAFLGFMDPEGEFTTRFLQLEGGTEYHGHDGLREWWKDVLAIFPDLRVDVLEVRDPGNPMIFVARVHGHGLDSGVPFEETLWVVSEWRDGKAIWSRNFGSEAEALEAAGLEE